MSEPFIAQVMMFGGNFAPRGWAFCDGQLLPISQNTALFSLVGTTYGGDGRTTFALPDLRGRVAIHPGRGPGLSDRRLGQRSGAETNTLTVAEMPNHHHGGGSLLVSNQAGEEATPQGGATLGGGAPIYNAEPPNTTLNAGSIAVNSEGGSQPVNNMQPFLAVNYIIALTGIYPSRS
ncbi:MAG: tail fiber protein [Gammaproteobacteria bacterium]